MKIKNTQKIGVPIASLAPWYNDLFYCLLISHNFPQFFIIIFGCPPCNKTVLTSKKIYYLVFSLLKTQMRKQYINVLDISPQVSTPLLGSYKNKILYLNSKGMYGKERQPKAPEMNF